MTVYAVRDSKEKEHLFIAGTATMETSVAVPQEAGTPSTSASDPALGHLPSRRFVLLQTLAHSVLLRNSLDTHQLISNENVVHSHNGTPIGCFL